MNKMIERVAKAIYNVEPHLNQGEPIPWEKLRGPLRDLAVQNAKAAIEAMREPTEAMSRAPENAGAIVLTLEGHQPLYPGNARQAWRFMINAALAPSEQPGGP